MYRKEKLDSNLSVLNSALYNQSPLLMHNRKLSKRYSQFSGELTPSPHEHRAGTNKSSVRREYKNADLDLDNGGGGNRGSTSPMSNFMGGKPRLIGTQGSIGINMEISRIRKNSKMFIKND